MCSAESRDCWKRGRYDQTSRPCTRSRMRPRPGRTSPGTCQGFMGCRPVGRERQDAGHTARSCFVWPRHLQRVTYLLVTTGRIANEPKDPLFFKLASKREFENNAIHTNGREEVWLFCR